MSAMRVPKTPFTQTSTVSPSSMRFTRQASMPALPVPDTGKVSSLSVWNSQRSMALLSSMILKNSGSR